MQIIDILGGLSDKLNKHQRQRIEDAEHRLEELEKENGSLRAEHSRLKERVLARGSSGNGERQDARGLAA